MPGVDAGRGSGGAGATGEGGGRGKAASSSSAALSSSGAASSTSNSARLAAGIAVGRAEQDDVVSQHLPPSPRAPLPPAAEAALLGSGEARVQLDSVWAAARSVFLSIRWCCLASTFRMARGKGATEFG